jgi:hypothetical protein
MIQRECQRNEDRRPQSFDWYKLVTQAMWMPLALLQADPPQPCEGTVMLMSKNQVEICRRILRRGQNGTGTVLMAIDATWKISSEGAIARAAQLPCVTAHDSSIRTESFEVL